MSVVDEQQGQKVGLDQLIQERAKFLIDQLSRVIPYAQELAGITDEARKHVEQQIAEFALSIKTSKLDQTQLEAFFKKSYYLQPVKGRADSWELIIPKFVDIHVGWLEGEKSTESYNVFLINRYMDWVGEIPEAIKRQLDWKPPPELILDGEELHGPKGALEYAWQRYRPFLHDRDEKRIKINPKRAFDLVASLIKDGVLPFNIRPVDSADLMNRKLDYELRDYQVQATNELKRFSAIGVYYPPGTGKTIIGLWTMTHLKPPHLVVVPTRLLREQWLERIQIYTDLQPEEYEVLTYQSAISRATAKIWSTLIIDEVHHLPANTFVKLALIRRKYTLGLSATPFREDGREEYVFALTGKPVGLSWDYFKKINLIKSPTCHVWIVKNFEAKIRRLDSLLQVDMRTVIFSDALETGRTLASRFKVPFVSHETKDQMETVKNNRVVIVSRVGDEGTSLPDLERVIEVSWLGGSRRQELQRTTRLLHSEQGQQENHILMTLEEYVHDRKRLFSIMDKGFKIVLHQEGVSERVIEDHTRMRVRTPNIHAPRITRPAERATEPAVSLPVVSGQSATFTSLPGVQHIMALMNPREKQFYTLLLDHDGEWFSRKRLPLLLGYASDDTMRHSIDFARMVERGWIEEKREGKKVVSEEFQKEHGREPSKDELKALVKEKRSVSYRTNMRGKMGG